MNVFRRVRLALALSTVCALVAFAAPANAATPIGSDGQIHACYKAKGKTKGALRLVAPGKACKAKKGEKAIAWSAVPSKGAVTPEQLSALLALIQQQGAQIEELSKQVLSLENVVCSQLSVLTDQANALRTVIGGLGLNGVLTALGGVLNIPALPAALAPFSCPS